MLFNYKSKHDLTSKWKCYETEYLAVFLKKICPGRFLGFVKWFCESLPEVTKPDRKVSFSF